LTKLAGRPKDTGRLVGFHELDRSTLSQETVRMILDNLFSILGGTGTAAVLFGIVSFVGFPAAATVMCPKSAYTRLQRSR
jgi:hypothetical protein